MPSAQVAFLPLGADLNTAPIAWSPRMDTIFLKLRSGMFDEASVLLPKVLSDQGIAPIIPPLATRSGQLWANLDALTAILYPFVEDATPTPSIRRIAGGRTCAALKKDPQRRLPRAEGRLRQETYDPWARQTVTAFLMRVETDAFEDPWESNWPHL